MDRVASRWRAAAQSGRDRTLTPDQLGRVRSRGRAGARRPAGVPDALLLSTSPPPAPPDANVVMLDYVSGSSRTTAGATGAATQKPLIRRRSATGRAVVASAVVGQRSQSGSIPQPEPGELPGLVGLSTAPTPRSCQPDADINFRCEKNRYGAVADLLTAFDPTTRRSCQHPPGWTGSTTRRRPTEGSKAKG